MGIIDKVLLILPQMNEIANTLSSLVSSAGVNTLLLGVLVYVGVLWVALILWVTKDITNRTNNMGFQIISISMIIFLTPVFGLPLYLLIRPSRTLMERYFEEVEQDMIEQYYDSVDRLDSQEESVDTAPKKKVKTVSKKKTIIQEDSEDDLD